MPSANVGINLTGILDYFRKGDDTEIFKKIQPQILQEMQAKLKPEGGGAPDYNGAEQALFNGWMSFRQAGGSEEAADKLFSMMSRSIVQKRLMDQQNSTMLLNKGGFEVGELGGTGSAYTPGGLPLVKRQSLGQRLMAPPQQPTINVGQGAIAETDLGEGMPPLDMNSQLTTPEGRKALMQKLTMAGMTGSANDQAEAANLIQLLSNADKLGRPNVKLSAPQYKYDANGNLVAVYSSTDEDAGTMSFKREPLPGLSDKNPRERSTSRGKILMDEATGRLFQEVTSEDATGKQAVTYEQLPPNLRVPGARPKEKEKKARPGSAMANHIRGMGYDVTPALEKELDEKLGKEGADLVRVLQAQIGQLEKKKARLEKSDVIARVNRNGIENSTAEEQKAYAEYQQIVTAIQEQEKALNNFLSPLDLLRLPPRSSAAPPLTLPQAGGLGGSASSQSPQAPAAVDSWIDSVPSARK